MQAIRVKYLGPTNSRGERMKAICAAGSLTRPYEYGATAKDLDCTEANADHAARALAHRLEWDLPHYPPIIYGGQLDNGDYVFCFLPSGYTKDGTK